MEIIRDYHRQHIYHTSLITYNMTCTSDRHAGVVYHQKGLASANDQGKDKHVMEAFTLYSEVRVIMVWSFLSQHWSHVHFSHHADMQELPEIVGALSRLIGEVQEDIKHNKDVWNRVFVRWDGQSEVKALTFFLPSVDIFDPCKQMYPIKVDHRCVPFRFFGFMLPVLHRQWFLLLQSLMCFIITIVLCRWMYSLSSIRSSTPW